MTEFWYCFVKSSPILTTRTVYVCVLISSFLIFVALQKVIGWFKFRRNTQGLVSMRERFIHHNLIKKLNFTPPKGVVIFEIKNNPHLGRKLSRNVFKS